MNTQEREAWGFDQDESPQEVAHHALKAVFDVIKLGTHLEMTTEQHDRLILAAAALKELAK